MIKKLLLLLLLVSLPAWPQASKVYGNESDSILNVTVATRPSSPKTGQKVYVTNGATSSDCTVGGGSSKVECTYDGSAWNSSSSASAGGSSGQCLYNSSGAIGGVTNCTTDGTNITAATFSGAITSSLGTITSNICFFCGTATLNNGAVVFKPAKLTYIVTAADATSELFSIYGGAAGTTPLFQVFPDGHVVFGGTGGSMSLVEAAAPSGVASSDILYADSTAHRLKMNNNNGGADTVVGAATTDTFTNKSMSEAQLTFTDITTGNSSTSNHGFLKKLSNSASQYMDGTGNWSTPSGSTVAANSMWFVCGGTVGTGNGSTYFFFPFLSGTSAACTVTSGTEMDVPTSCTMKNLRVRAAAAGGSAGSGVITLYKDNSASTLTCTLGTGTSCSDVTHTVAMTAGTNVFSIRVTTGQATDTTGNIKVTLECD